MNSFFASVEQQANPFLRGKPLGVSPSSHPTSCLIGTSREAKALGIKNGISLAHARKICPQIIAIKSEPEKYREVSRQVVKIFSDYTDRIEVYSVDEAFLDLSCSSPRIGEVTRPTPSGGRGRGRTHDLPPPTPPILGGEKLQNPLLIASEIKQRIKQEVGEWLTCSVGIAQNKFLCKLAADMQKPDGLSILWRDQLPEIYKHKKLEDLWGINRGWKKRLEKLGIISPLQLLSYPVENLIALFGKPGYWIWQRVNGLEEDKIKRNPELVSGSKDIDPEINSGLREDSPKSFGHSWVLNFRTTDKAQLKIAILRLAEKAARRMRREGFVASGMYLSITLVDNSYYHKSKKLSFRIETGLELYEQAMKMWRDWKFTQAVMHIAVGFTYLSLKVKQLSLFSDKFSNLTPTLDYLNDKYGEFAIRSGLLTKTSDYAPDAIAFGR